jgi:pilus assembly protein CpaF
MLDDVHINLKDIFVYRQRGVDKNGKVVGVYTPTGYIPSFYDDIIARGIPLSRDIFLPTEII